MHRPIIEIVDQEYLPEEICEPYSVCMTVKNEAGSIAALLGQIENQTAPPAQVVVMDNGSSDGTSAIIRRWASGTSLRINLAGTPGAHISLSRNLSVAVAEHDLLVFLDGGNPLENQYTLANLVGPMMGGGGPDICSGISKPMVDCEWTRRFIPEWSNEEFMRTGFLPSTKCMAIRRSLFDAVGGFSTEMVRHGQDTLFSIRAAEVSRLWIVNRSAVVLWAGPTTKVEAVRLAYRYGHGDGEVGCQYVDDVATAQSQGWLDGSAMRRSRGHATTFPLDPKEVLGA